MKNEELLKQIPSFLNKLYDILENVGYATIFQEYSTAIRWNNDGNNFQILDQNLLVEEILPHYFKHKNYQSFLRQLNMYGFKKLKEIHNIHEFQHSSFRRGFRLRNDLIQIRRRNQEDIKKTFETLTKDFQNESLNQEHENLRRQLIVLKSYQTKLHDEFMVQIDRNYKLRNETQNLIQKVNQVKVSSIQRLNKLSLIIARLPSEAAFGKFAKKKDKIIDKINQINSQFNSNFYEKQDSFSYPNNVEILTAQSPLVLGNHLR